MGDDPNFEAWEKQIEDKRSQDREHKRARREEGDDDVDWRKLPPYALEDPDQQREPMYTGHCHCEQVKFEVFDKPKDAHFCHCGTCQKIHGAPVHWSAIISKTDVHFINGAEGLSFYRTSDKRTVHELPCKLTCSHCHAPIADEGRNMLLLYPSLLNLESHEDREPWAPQRHVFYTQRAMDIVDGKDKFSEMQNESDLMPEQSENKGIIGSKKQKRANGAEDQGDKDEKTKSGKKRKQK